jgi:hypothetical protein
VIETDQAKSDQYKDAGESVATQHGRRSFFKLKIKSIPINSTFEQENEEETTPTVISGKESTENGSASASSSVVNKRQNSLSGNAQFRWCIVGDVGASGGPDGGVSHTLDQFEWNDAPGFADVGNVKETQDAAEQTQTQHLDGANKRILFHQPLNIIHLYLITLIWPILRMSG